MKTKITKEREQFRTTIPKKLMEETYNKKGDVVEWENKKGKLSASVLTHEEFLKKVADTQKLENQTKDAFCEVEE